MNACNSLKEILICKLCNECYEDPIILPCGRSVCSKHVYIESKSDVFKCLLCAKKHLIPAKRFCKNEDLNQLISVSDKYVNIDNMLGENNTKAAELCSKLEDSIKNNQSLSNNPSFYVYDYFSKVKSDLDTNRELLIKIINKNYDHLLTEIEEAESRCIINIEKLETNISILNKSIQSFNQKYASFISFSKSPKLNSDQEWFEFENKIEKEISKSNYMNKKFQNDLLIDKIYEFKSKLIKNENLLGDLSITNGNFPNENRIEGTIKFEINDFKSFRYKKSFKYDRDWCVIDKIKWTACAAIKENLNYNQYIELFVKPDCDMITKPIKAKISSKLLKTNGQIYESKLNKVLDFTFFNTDNAYIDFCFLKDIYLVENEIYDKLKDSIKLEIEIRILK